MVAPPEAEAPGEPERPPLVGRVARMWRDYDKGEEEPEDWMEIRWFYRPEDTALGRVEGLHGARELFASDHTDENPVACIESRCRVLPYTDLQRLRTARAAAAAELEAKEDTFYVRHFFNSARGEFLPLAQAEARAGEGFYVPVFEGVEALRARERRREEEDDEEEAKEDEERDLIESDDAVLVFDRRSPGGGGGGGGASLGGGREARAPSLGGGRASQGGRGDAARGGGGGGASGSGGRRRQSGGRDGPAAAGGGSVRGAPAYREGADLVVLDEEEEEEEEREGEARAEEVEEEEGEARGPPAPAARPPPHADDPIVLDEEDEEEEAARPEPIHEAEPIHESDAEQAAEAVEEVARSQEAAVEVDELEVEGEASTRSKVAAEGVGHDEVDELEAMDEDGEEGGAGAAPEWPSLLRGRAGAEGGEEDPVDDAPEGFAQAPAGGKDEEGGGGGGFVPEGDAAVGSAAEHGYRHEGGSHEGEHHAEDLYEVPAAAASPARRAAPLQAPATPTAPFRTLSAVLEAAGLTPRRAVVPETIESPLPPRRQAAEVIDVASPATPARPAEAAAGAAPPPPRQTAAAAAPPAAVIEVMSPSTPARPAPAPPLPEVIELASPGTPARPPAPPEAPPTPPGPWPATPPRAAPPPAPPPSAPAPPPPAVLPAAPLRGGEGGRGAPAPPSAAPPPRHPPSSSQHAAPAPPAPARAAPRGPPPILPPPTPPPPPPTPLPPSAPTFAVPTAGPSRAALPSRAAASAASSPSAPAGPSRHPSAAAAAAEVLPSPPCSPPPLPSLAIVEPPARPPAPVFALRPSLDPPARSDLAATLRAYGLPHIAHQDPYYSDRRDVPTRPRHFAGREFRVPAIDTASLPEFDTRASVAKAREASGLAPLAGPRGLCHWPSLLALGETPPPPTRVYALAPARPPPPTSREAREWLEREADGGAASSQRSAIKAERVDSAGRLVLAGAGGTGANDSAPFADGATQLSLLTGPRAGRRSARLSLLSRKRSHDLAREAQAKRSKPEAEGAVPRTPDPPAERPPSPKYAEGHRGSINTGYFGGGAGAAAVESPAGKAGAGSAAADSPAKSASSSTGASRSAASASEGGQPPAAPPHVGQFLTILSLEVHVNTRGEMRPDPRADAVAAIVYAVHNDAEQDRAGHGPGEYRPRVGILLVEPTEEYPQAPAAPAAETRPAEAAAEARARGAAEAPGAPPSPSPPSNPRAAWRLEFVGERFAEAAGFPDEAALFRGFVAAVRRMDPDVLLGYEVQGGSLGYLLERGPALGIDLQRELSRSPSLVTPPERREDSYGVAHATGVHIAGRHVLNVWRLMRGELKLNMYSLENVAWHVLKTRLPHYPFSVLTRWWEGAPASAAERRPPARWRVGRYLAQRARASLALLEAVDLVRRTSELARTFGIDFFAVLSRGSQYRVESMLLRIAKPQNYVLLSPSKAQVEAQPAIECIPMVMEPESRFYTSPVIVFDFQSLYPSMVIAYNLCFSTCLGKVQDPRPAGPKRLGVDPRYAAPKGALGELEREIFVSPNGVMFLRPQVRAGVLPRMLREILDTRVMVKRAMKEAKGDPLLCRMLNARQFGLKMIANVTYGYTAAGFSGRMPCSDIADAIVETGRDTLTRAIATAESGRWNARVVYGDTDSMFVLVPGASREEAFRVGAEIAAAVTAANPRPVRLQMEKVYHPCVLVTKKRYVGYAYESPAQAVPVFDAKGIESVRRDQCGATQRIMEKAIRLLFADPDLSKVKRYLQKQWTKIASGRTSLQDLIFAREVRLGTYSARGQLPPAAVVTVRSVKGDPRAEPRYGERVPYVVAAGPTGAFRLVDHVMSPHEFLRAQLGSGGGARINAAYYITKTIIPPLQRIFQLVGADLEAWYHATPKPARASAAAAGPSGATGASRPGGSTLEHYYLSRHCPVCDALTPSRAGLCPECAAAPAAPAYALLSRVRRHEAEGRRLAAACGACGGSPSFGVPPDVPCDSLDCPAFFARKRWEAEEAAVGGYRSLLRDAEGLCGW